MNDDELKNFFHDLKNDLTSMTALCNLHRLYGGALDADEVLNRLTERQMIISTAYERLYQENNFPYVNLKNFIDELISKESSFFAASASNVQLKKSTANIALPIKKAMPIAQILVELLSNSYRHAFKGPEQTRSVLGRNIEFSISEQESGQLLLNYSDSGTGLPEDFTPERQPSLGMQLITSISRQLGNRVEYQKEEKGFSAKLLINI